MTRYAATFAAGAVVGALAAVVAFAVLLLRMDEGDL